MKSILELLRFVKRFGLNHGLHTFFQIKSSKMDKIRLPENAYPLALRPDTSDLKTFYQIFWWREYDFPVDADPKIIIDAGANIGLASIYFANRFPNAQIIAIEPEASNFELLIQNTKYYTNVQCYQIALSNKSGQSLTVKDNGIGHWGFSVESASNKVPNNQTISSISLNQIMEQQQLQKLDLVKIDIEGHELELFETNTASWLPKTHQLVIETHDAFKRGCSKSVFKAVSAFNFSFSMRGENLIFTNDDPV